MKWPEKSYLVNPFHGFVYCPIPKAGLSSITTWFLKAVEPEADHRLDTEEADAALEPFVLQSWGARRAEKVLRDPDYFKFAIVRNPYSRLVSAFLNKFLHCKRVVRQPVRHALARRRWGQNWQGDWAIGCGWLMDRLTGRYKRHHAKIPADFTFREFVSYLAETNLHAVNRHWRPQHLFLEGCEFDFIGKLENLTADFAHIQQQVGISHSLPHLNASSMDAEFADSDECWAEMPLEQLQKMANFPNYTAFYNPELKQLVAALYRDDFERFGYNIHGPHDSETTFDGGRKVA